MHVMRPICTSEFLLKTMRSPTSEYAGKMRNRLSQAGICTEITTRSGNELQYRQRTAASLVVRSKRPQRFLEKSCRGNVH